MEFRHASGGIAIESKIPAMVFQAVPTASTDVVSGVVTAVVAIAVVFVLLLAVGFFLLVRRRRGSAEVPVPGRDVDDLADLSRSANIALVRLDDAVKENEDEVGFAAAQFGDERTRGFADAIAGARAGLTEAFRLKQELDDSVPDSHTKQREWNQKILRLCETAQDALTRESGTFDALRRDESNAPSELKAVGLLIVSTSMRVPGADATLAELSHSYSPAVIDGVRENVNEARAQLRAAGEKAGAAERLLADPGATGAADLAGDARSGAQEAAGLIDAVESLAESLTRDSARLNELAARTEADLAEARAARDAAPDPDAGGRIADAITAIESDISHLDRADPAASIARLQSGIAALDSALAKARNQAQRAEHAIAALAGVLVSAHSQITATEEFISGNRGGIGAEARTRLAEAKRLLTVAEAQADPVDALDTARSSATYSRDADALARYDALR
ncbi:MAG: hypothetical protein JWM49_2333 [Microbacteriaceae bacterium]|nr:hypothetical protein [Microbacteriaceae bacterium]